MRTLQEWMGHRDFKTTLIYADYAPSPAEADLVNAAFRGINLGINLKETRSKSDPLTPVETGVDTTPHPCLGLFWSRRSGVRVPSLTS